MNLTSVQRGSVLVLMMVPGLSIGQDSRAAELVAADTQTHGTTSERDGFLSRLLAGGRRQLFDRRVEETRPTLGNRFWVGPRWEERTGNDGGFPLRGELDGLAIGVRSRNVDALFVSLEAVFLDGAFELTTGDLTDYNEFQLETLLGQTWEHSSCDLFVTPYAGLRYRDASNALRSASLTADVTQHAWNAPFGIRSDYLVSDTLAVGLDSRIQWKFQDRQVVTYINPPIADDIQDTKSRFTYRIEVPVTFRLGARGEVAVRPYYEWDRFDARQANRSTRIREDGIDLSFLIVF